MKNIFIILLMLPVMGLSQTFLPPQSQKFMSKMKGASYSPTIKNFDNIHFIGLHLYNNIKEGGITYVDVHTLLDIYYPIIGSTAAVQAIDFVRLTTGTYNGGITNNADSWNGNGTTGYFNSGFTPTASQTNYHLGVYSLTNEAASNKPEMGNASGQTQFLIGVSKNSLLNSGTGLCNIFTTTTPSSTFTAVASTIGYFLWNRPTNTQEQEFYNGSQQGTTVTHNAITCSPGALLIGHDANTSWGFATKKIATAHAGPAPTTIQGTSLYQAALFKVNHS